MKQQASLALIIGGLFALWLYNTGRVAAFKQFVLDSPGHPTLPGGTKTAAASGSGTGGPDAKKIAQCGAAASEGIVTADCVSAFLSGLSRPGDVIGSAVSTLTFGVVKL